MKGLSTQRTGYDCGPTAIHNAAVLLNRHPDISFAALLRACGTDRDGTTKDGMKRGLAAYGIAYIEYCPLSLRADALDRVRLTRRILDGMCGRGDVLILGYKAGKEGHYSAVRFDHERESFYAFNCSDDETVENRSHTLLELSWRVTREWLEEKLTQPEAEIFLL